MHNLLSESPALNTLKIKWKTLRFIKLSWRSKLSYPCGGYRELLNVCGFSVVDFSSKKCWCQQNVDTIITNTLFFCFCLQYVLYPAVLERFSLGRKSSEIISCHLKIITSFPKFWRENENTITLCPDDRYKSALLTLRFQIGEVKMNCIQIIKFNIFNCHYVLMYESCQMEKITFILR